jgi:hypothetical protein
VVGHHAVGEQLDFAATVLDGFRQHPFERLEIGLAMKDPPPSDGAVENVVGVAGNIDSGSSSHGSNLSAFARLVNGNGIRLRSHPTLST